MLLELILRFHRRVLGKLRIAAGRHVLEGLIAGQMVPGLARERLLTRPAVKIRPDIIACRSNIVVLTEAPKFHGRAVLMLDGKPPGADA